MTIVIMVEVLILVYVTGLLGVSLIRDHQRRVIGRLTVMAITILNIGLVIARGEVLGAGLSTTGASILGTIGVCAFVACVTWELSDAKVYEYWLATFLPRASD